MLIKDFGPPASPSQPGTFPAERQDADTGRGRSDVRRLDGNCVSPVLWVHVAALLVCRLSGSLGGWVSWLAES